jgi:predicted phage baseplate assembly protein
VQAAPVRQTWSIAPGATVDGTPVPGQPARLEFELRAGALTSLRVAPADDTEPAFLVLGYTAPTYSATGTLTVQAALAGTGSGEPEQTIVIGPRPLVEGSFRLFSLESPGWRAWECVDDFAASTRAAAHVRLDPTSGALTFGDGEHGRTPDPGSPLVACFDVTAAGAGGGRVTAVADTPPTRVRLSDPSVVARLRVAGQAVLEPGTAAEPLAHAIGRAIDGREASLRAVTVEDFETIARATPGTRIARVAVRPNLYPGLDCVSAPGVVTVIVVPSLPARRPSPGPGLVSAVARRLERRRTIGTRVVVIGPGYQDVAVVARVKGFDGVDAARLRRDVADALDAFLHPLRGGPERTGWPLGRDVFRAEIMQVIDETAGVDHVLSLELLAGGAPTCGNVCLPPTWLVAAGAHLIEVL